MWIFGPLPWPTISAVTVAFARAAASLVTVSPSTRSRTGRATVSPASPARRFTVNVSPTATLCWLPPAFTTAYTTDSSFASSCPASLSGAHDRSRRRVLDGLRTPLRRHREVPARWRCNPISVPELFPLGRHGLGHSGRGRSGRRSRRPAGGPATARPRGHGGGVPDRRHRLGCGRVGPDRAGGQEPHLDRAVAGRSCVVLGPLDRDGLDLDGVGLGRGRLLDGVGFGRGRLLDDRGRLLDDRHRFGTLDDVGVVPVGSGQHAGVLSCPV